MSQPWYTPVTFLGTRRQLPCPMSQCRPRRCTLSMMAGMWPASLSFYSSSSLFFHLLPWLCSMNCWTVGAAPKGRHINHYRQRSREAAVGSCPVFARSQNPTLKWFGGSEEFGVHHDTGSLCWLPVRKDLLKLLCGVCNQNKDKKD